MLLDDPSFVFNKLDHLVLKAETRAFLKLANQIIHLNCTPVVLADSVRGYIDEDNTEDLRLYCHPLLFTNVSDIVYASKNEQNLLALTLLKSGQLAAATAAAERSETIFKAHGAAAASYLKSFPAFRKRLAAGG